MTRQPPSHDLDAVWLPALRGALGLGEPAGASGHARDPAWAIDTARARVVAANEHGAERLGMRGPEIAMSLDAAMPALRRLREIAAVLQPGQEMHETLLFWTRTGAERIDARVRRIADAPGVLIVGGMCAGDNATRPPDTPDRGETAATPAASPQAPRDDAAILREIARRIREGQGRSRPPEPATQAGRSAAVAAAAEAAAEPDATPTVPQPAIDVDKLAHELKTPLSAIVAASEIMRDERFGPVGNERYRGYASDIHDSARHALAVINNMLDQHGERSDAGAASAMDVGEQPQLFAQVDLNAIVESTVSAMAPLAGKSVVSVVARIAARLPNVIADPVSIRQILLNLLTNAVKFTPAGGAVTVATRYTLDGPVEIIVSDTGPGMSADDISRVLEPGAGSERGPRHGGGLGIGLPLVRQLAEANGATVTIDSTPGSGTRAIVSFAKGRVVPV